MTVRGPDSQQCAVVAEAGSGRATHGQGSRRWGWGGGGGGEQGELSCAVAVVRSAQNEQCLFSLFKLIFN
jgi:hypothetical protein